MSEQRDWERLLIVVVGAHVTEHTQIDHHLYPGDDRVTVTVRGTSPNSAEVTLFLPRAELLRLRDTLTGVARKLDRAKAAAARGVDTFAA